ncbi:DUF4153 domain-containing protein [Pseudoduganella sp. LjRoot289]|uniref:DUF4153 domain-containing protein n=1 Tax=Pseudoduganella sp. LjRoot289 TaxID=3342314 RepID=UPI003ECFEAF6
MQAESTQESRKESAQVSLEASTTRATGYARLAVGLSQGVLLYLLYAADQHNSWPASVPLLFVPMLMAGLLLPVLLISSLGHIGGRRLAAWMAVAAATVVALALHDAWRNVGGQGFKGAAGQSRYPSTLLSVFILVFFFIAHSLVMAGVQEGRRLAAYATYFETAWKLFIQAMFSALFVGVLWLMLNLGSALFMLVKLDFLKKLLGHAWFNAPVLCFAFASAMHITDVRPAIVRGIRTLLLVLMSWLLPVTVMLLGGFLAMLPFTGLESLWKTGHATAALLGAGAMLVVFINAAYQNGEVADGVAGVLRASARIAAVLMLPVTAIAVYALGLRVGDYGWSSDRIIAAACLLVAACYALGYAYAAGQRAAWLPTVAMTNIGAAWLVLAVLLALFTPIADPARISVNSQMARLERGEVTAKAFDYGYLRFEGARYGRAALERLKAATGPDAALKRAGAIEALSKDYRFQVHGPAAKAASSADIGANLTVWPKGATLPDGFPLSGWEKETPQSDTGPLCLRKFGQPCDAFILDLTGDGKPEVLLVGAEREVGTAVLGEVDGKWENLGHLPYDASGCPALLSKLKSGKFQAIPKPVQDLQVDGQRLVIERNRQLPQPGCR